jgi:uncharacterized protein
MAGEKVELVRSLYQAFARRDQAAVLAAVDPEVEFIQTEELPWGGYYKGAPEGVHSFFSKLMAAVDSRVEIDKTWEAGNAVVVVGRTIGTVKANGKPFDVDIVHVWTIREGKVVRFNPYIDTPRMLEALKN